MLGAGLLGSSLYVAKQFIAPRLYDLYTQLVSRSAQQQEQQLAEAQQLAESRQQLAEAIRGLAAFQKELGSSMKEVSGAVVALQKQAQQQADDNGTRLQKS